MSIVKKYLNLENLIYLAIFLLPAYLIRLKIFGLPTNLLEIIIGIIFIIWAFGYIKNKTYPDFFGLLDKKYFPAIFLILAGMAFSAFYNPNWTKGLSIIKSWFFIPLIFYFIAADTLKKEKAINAFWAYYFSSSAVALASIFYLVLGKLTYDGRLEAFFNSPNYLAMYLAPALSIGLVQVQSSKLKVKSLGIFFSLIILAAFYFTYSYAAWISVALSAAIILAIQQRISLKKIFLFFGIIILVVFTQIKSNKMNSLVGFETRSSLSSRVMIWKSSVKMLKNNWAAGIGPGNFQNAYLEYQKYFPPYLEWAVPHPHNIFLAFWLSGGIAGIAGFFLLIFFWFKDFFKSAQKNTVEIMALGIMLYILIHGLADTTYFKNDLAVVFWMCFLALKNKF